MAVGPDLVLPGADAAIGGDIGLEFDRHGRAKGRPAEFVLARPLHLHRLARHGARQQHRVVGGIVGGVVSVATRAFDVLHDDALGRECQRHGQVGAQVINALAVRPDFDSLGIPFGNGAGGPDGGMGEKGAVVGGAKAFCRRCCRAVRLFFTDEGGVCGLCLQEGRQVVHVGQCRRLAPGGGGDELFQRLDGDLLALGDDAQKAAVAHGGDHSGHRPHCSEVDIKEFCPR